MNTPNLAPHAVKAYSRLSAHEWYGAVDYVAPCGRCMHPAVAPEDLQEVDDRDALARAIARERGQAYTREDLLRDLERERAEALERGQQPCGLACRLWLVGIARDAWADAQDIMALLGQAVEAAQEGQWCVAFSLAYRAMSIERDWGAAPTCHYVLRAICRDWEESGGCTHD